MLVRQMAMLHLSRARSLPRRPVVTDTPAKKAPWPIWSSAALTYIICTNPRSGSWLLSDGLSSTHIAGYPREWFNKTEEERQRAQWQLDFRTDLSFPHYLRIARESGTTSNGVSGVKLHYYQLVALYEKFQTAHPASGWSAAQFMSKFFPGARYIWLRRRDKARQAISLDIANSTNEWWKIDGTDSPKRAHNDVEPPFDPHAIARIEGALQRSDVKWQAYFQEAGIDPLMVDYEELAADYPAALKKVLDWLGLDDAKAVIPEPRLKQQSDARNAQWLSRYLALKELDPELQKLLEDDSADTPLFGRDGKEINKIPDIWKQWVAQAILNDVDSAVIATTLKAKGYSTEAVAEELSHAQNHPYLLGARRMRQRLALPASQLSAMGQLARLDSRATLIDRCANLSLDEFRDRYYAASRPLVITDAMADWRAMKAWTPDYLKQVCGDQVVEVMTGRDADPKYELNATLHRTSMRLADYIDMVYGGKVTNDYCLAPSNRFFQHPSTTALLSDLSPLPHFLNPSSVDKRSFLAFGPEGTVTPLHRSSGNAFIAHVTGRKRYRLVPASQWQFVYVSGGIFSDVDAERPAIDLHPKFADATLIDVVVNPGEALFVPLGWWHHVRTLDICMSISFANFAFPNHFQEL
jgi:LPS sulfotransferase NodH